MSSFTHFIHVFLFPPFLTPPPTSKCLHLETQSSASLRSTCPNHLSMPRLTTLSTLSIPNPRLSSSLFLLSFRVTPDIHLTILFSVLTSLRISTAFIGQVSLPYTSTLCTHALPAEYYFLQTITFVFIFLYGLIHVQPLISYVHGSLGLLLSDYHYHRHHHHSVYRQVLGIHSLHTSQLSSIFQIIIIIIVRRLPLGRFPAPTSSTSPCPQPSSSFSHTNHSFSFLSSLFPLTHFPRHFPYKTPLLDHLSSPFLVYPFASPPLFPPSHPLTNRPL